MKKAEEEVLKLYSLEHANLFHVENGKKSALILNKPLHVLYYANPGMVFIAIEDFRYSLSPEIPTIRHGKSYLYVLPDIDSYYGIELHSTTKEADARVFEKILKENSSFAIVVEENLRQEKLKGAEKEDEKDQSLTFASVLSKGAEFIKSVAIKGAEIISIGVKKGGEFITAKLIKKRSNPLKVGKTTQQLIHFAKEATGKTVEVSKFAV